MKLDFSIYNNQITQVLKTQRITYIVQVLDLLKNKKGTRDKAHTWSWNHSLNNKRGPHTLEEID